MVGWIILQHPSLHARALRSFIIFVKNVLDTFFVLDTLDTLYWIHVLGGMQLMIYFLYHHIGEEETREYLAFLLEIMN